MTEVVLGADIPAGDLDGLCRAVWKRVAWEMYHIHDDRPQVWLLLNERLHLVRQGITMTGVAVATRATADHVVSEFELDLREMLVIPKERLDMMVRGRSTHPRSLAVHAGERQRVAEQATAERNASVGLPKVQPAELLARLASAGMIVSAVDGNLHVQPAELLGEADRAALAANKAAIVAALARPATVI